MTTYSYIRVSTLGKGQSTENQRKQIVDAGYAVDAWYSEEGISGSVKAQERPEFSKMLALMVRGDQLVISMVDRLGRCASDILNVVEMFKAIGVRVRILQFDGIDITSSMGKMVLTCMAAMSELERNILIERVNAGLERTKAQGKVLGPPLSISPSTLSLMFEQKAAGATLDSLVVLHNIPRNTIARNLSKWKGKMEEYLSEYACRKAQWDGRAVMA